MKILIVTNLYTPDFCGGAAQFTDLANGLTSRGHQVTVFSAFPYYPEWKKKSKYGFFRVRRDSISGIVVIRHGLYIPKNPSRLLLRIAYELSFAIVLCRSLLRSSRQDVIMVFCPLLGAVIFGVMRKWLLREKLWINIQDIPTDAAIAAGISKPGAFHWLALHFQRWLFRRGDMVTTISGSIQRRLIRIIGGDRQIQVCSNWLVADLNIPREKKSAVADLDGRALKLLYCGNIGKKQGLLEFCQILQKVQSEFQFTIRGDGAAKVMLQNWIDNTQDRRFSLTGFLDDDQFVNAIAAADMFVLTEKPAAGFSFVPSKLIPAISIGTPLLVVSDAQSPLGEEVNRFQLGLHFCWEDLAELKPRLSAFNGEDQKRYRENCLNRSTYYQRENAFDRYEEKLGAMIS